MINPKNAIEVRNITKKFRVYLDKGHTLKEKTLFRKRRKYEERSVLNGISFEVKKGEAVGLIGHNGCGKSTTLKLLTKIMYPDSGTIEMNGRVSSLIELGAGFHQDLSGRENIYINASIFGLTKKEIDEHMNDIIAFSELEEFIDNPVRTYSSGMYMRLAFSVAINVQADILLIDEILAVGDANFQAKCFEKLREIKKSGITIVIVSHSLNQIEQICDRSIWLDDGKIRSFGTPREVHPIYLDYMGQKRKDRKQSEQKEQEERQEKDKQTREKEETKEKQEKHIPDRPKELGNMDVRIVKAELFNDDGVKTETFQTEAKMTLRVEYETKNEDVGCSEFGFHIFRSDGTDCYGTNTVIDKIENVKLRKQGVIEVVFDSVHLLKGKYKMDLALHDEYGLTYHHIYEAVEFEILSIYEEVGVSRLQHRWLFDQKEPKNRW